MEPDALLTTLRSLRAERSCDTSLFAALSQRFLANAEELFPPQVDELLGAFADLSYSDEAILHAFTGRLGDLIADASPRRVLRLLRNGAALRLPPEAWLEDVLEHLHRHLHNLREGLPSALSSLRQLGHHDPELTELLLAQGLISYSELGPGFFSRLFEQWSLHHSRNSEAEERAAALAKDLNSLPDIRDGLNLLAGFWRCGAYDDASSLEESLSERLKSAGGTEAVVALAWMRRVSLHSPQLWQLGAESVEVSLKDQRFVREHLPDALQSLAALIAGRSSNAEQEDDVVGREVELVANLLNTSEVHAALPRYDAQRALQLFSAASLLCSTCAEKGNLGARIAQTIPWAPLSEQVARLSRQLSLPERRQLVVAARSSVDFSQHHGIKLSPQFSHQVDPQRLSVVSLPPLPPFMDKDAAAKAPSRSAASSSLGLGTYEALWWSSLPDGQGGYRKDKGHIRYLGQRDVFAQQSKSVHITPACSLVARALELDGWHLTLCP